MAQLERFVVTSPAADHRPVRVGRVAVIGIGIFFVIVLSGLIGLVISQTVDGSGLERGTQAGETVDGWMPAIEAANRAAADAAMLAEAARTRDGWSSALLKPEPVVRDGWSSALLKPEPKVVDGWSVRYLVSDDE